jgi:hydrogenase expression/formation protein HypC
VCVAIPAQIVSISGLEAEVEVGTIRRNISLWLTPEAQVGQYVYLHAGYAISVLDKEEAEESLQLLRSLADGYPEE